ncbi:hypothetical protein APHAL10511_004760 [Amanita phalloides]|nr:hypothetical protein APHAL10511_004760 [Amanita phalloides]
MAIKPLIIALVYELLSTYLERGCSISECAELSTEKEIDGISSTLENLGHRVVHIPDIKCLVQQLAAGKEKEWSVVFNYAEGVYGVARESQVPALLEAYQIPFTFSDAGTTALCHDKGKTKMVLERYGIPTAPFSIVPYTEQTNYDKYASSIGSYPLFAKPIAQGSSIGIQPSSKIYDVTQVAIAVDDIKATFPGQDILIEKFLSGREFTVGILGNGKNGRVIGVREILWRRAQENSSEPFDDFATYGTKEHPEWIGCRSIKADETDPQVKMASETAMQSWRVLKCRDAARIDIRYDEKGDVPYVMEVNTNPGLGDQCQSLLPQIAEDNGISYEMLLGEIVQNALDRAD